MQRGGGRGGTGQGRGEEGKMVGRELAETEEEGEAQRSPRSAISGTRGESLLSVCFSICLSA